MEQEPLNIGLQQANHLLGFKEDKRPSRPRFWLAVAASLLLGGAVVFFLLKSVVDGIRLPQTTVAWAVLKRGGELPSIAPRLWREAASRTATESVRGESIPRTRSIIERYSPISARSILRSAV